MGISEEAHRVIDERREIWARKAETVGRELEWEIMRHQNLLPMIVSVPVSLGKEIGIADGFIRQVVPLTELYGLLKPQELKITNVPMLSTHPADNLNGFRMRILR